MASEFKEFLLKANVLALALAFIVGVALAAVVNSLVKDIIMPPIGLLMGGADFSNHFVTLKGERFATLAEAQAAGAVTLNYGLFLNTLVTFLIVALAIFIIVKRINAMTRKEEAPVAPTTRACPECLSDIPLAAKRCRYCAVAVG